MTSPELIAHHALNPAHLEALAPHARRLAELLGGLSMLVWREPWRRHLEHQAWQALQEAGADRETLGLDALACAELRQRAHEAGGWIIDSDGPRFVPAPTWRVASRGVAGAARGAAVGQGAADNGRRCPGMSGQWPPFGGRRAPSSHRW